eukprot:5017818-Prymnesium_polylepis.1
MPSRVVRSRAQTPHPCSTATPCIVRPPPLSIGWLGRASPPRQARGIVRRRRERLAGLDGAERGGGQRQREDSAAAARRRRVDGRADAQLAPHASDGGRAGRAR